MKTLLGALCVLVLSAPAARAADLINQDNKAYSFKMFDGNISSNRKIRARGSLYGLCTPNSQCKIVLAGQTISFDSNARIKISGGKLSR